MLKLCRGPQREATSRSKARLRVGWGACGSWRDRPQGVGVRVPGWWQGGPSGSGALPAPFPVPPLPPSPPPAWPHRPPSNLSLCPFPHPTHPCPPRSRPLLGSYPPLLPPTLPLFGLPPPPPAPPAPPPAPPAAPAGPGSPAGGDGDGWPGRQGRAAALAGARAGRAQAAAGGLRGILPRGADAAVSRQLAVVGRSAGFAGRLQRAVVRRPASRRLGQQAPGGQALAAGRSSARLHRSTLPSGPAVSVPHRLLSQQAPPCCWPHMHPPPRIPPPWPFQPYCRAAHTREQNIAMALVPTKPLALGAVAFGSLASVCWPALVALQTSGVEPHQQGAVLGAMSVRRRRRRRGRRGTGKGGWVRGGRAAKARGRREGQAVHGSAPCPQPCPHATSVDRMLPLRPQPRAGLQQPCACCQAKHPPPPLPLPLLPPAAPCINTSRLNLIVLLARLR